MTKDGLLNITISYEANQQRGEFSVDSPTDSAIWDRILQSASTLTDDYALTPTSISVPWPSVLSLVREYAPNQKKWDFRFRPKPDAKSRIISFLAQYRAVREARSSAPVSISVPKIKHQLEVLGFTKRKLKDFQLRDIQRLLSLQNGANFSVPGAGKTTVTFALNLLTRQEGQHLLVVGPKSSFQAWAEVVEECVGDEAPEWVKEPFTVLSGGSEAIRKTLASGSTRFVINYDQLINAQDIISAYLLQYSVHMVLDESHRMKGGFSVRRGAVLLNIATLPVRRDILSGTPMPQASTDIQSQIDFLWPGSGLGFQIARGSAPRSVIGNLYVRTTKADLGLPPVARHFIQVEMGKGQSALYAIVRNEVLRNLSSLRSGSASISFAPAAP